jgi:hypothetical protein
VEENGAPTRSALQYQLPHILSDEARPEKHLQLRRDNISPPEPLKTGHHLSLFLTTFKSVFCKSISLSSNSSWQYKLTFPTSGLAFFSTSFLASACPALIATALSSRSAQFSHSRFSIPFQVTVANSQVVLDVNLCPIQAIQLRVTGTYIGGDLMDTYLLKSVLLFEESVVSHLHPSAKLFCNQISSLSKLNHLYSNSRRNCFY